MIRQLHIAQCTCRLYGYILVYDNISISPYTAAFILSHQPLRYVQYHFTEAWLAVARTVYRQCLHQIYYAIVLRAALWLQKTEHATSSPISQSLCFWITSERFHFKENISSQMSLSRRKYRMKVSKTFSLLVSRSDWQYLPSLHVATWIILTTNMSLCG